MTPYPLQTCFLISKLVCVCFSGSVVSNSLRPHGLQPARQAPLSMEFLRQEYCRGLPFPAPGDLPDPGTELRSPALQADSLPAEPPGKPIFHMGVYVCQSQSPNSSHTPILPPHDHISVLYIWVSISALQIDSPVPFF